MTFGAAVHRTLLTGTILATTAFGALAAPTDYSLLTTIAIPADSANNQGGAMTGFDISYVDPVTGDYYFADRSNASVDIFSGSSNTFIGRATGFVGQQSATSMSGPDGVLVVDTGSVATLYAGDAGSTLRSFNVTNPSNPVATGSVNTNGGAFRVDEMAYSPSNKLLFVANNANAPAFASLISTAVPTAPSLVTSPIPIPGQTNSAGGMEQSIWNPATGTFFVSVPQFGNSDSGGVQEFSATGAALRTFNFSNMGIASCAPAGLALGASGNLMVGCGNTGTQTVVLNPAGTGSIVAQLSQVSGSDELWYDPTTGNYYVTGVNAAGHRVINVYSDSNYSLLQSIDLTALGAGTSNLHSVAVDPLNGEIFVPLTGTTSAFTDTLCPSGCVAVFSQVAQVPEPASLAIVLVALTGMVGYAGWRRRSV